MALFQSPGSVPLFTVMSRSRVQKILFPTDDFHFIFFKKYYSPLLLLCPLVPPNLLHPTKSNLYLANSLTAAVSEPVIYRLLTFHVPNKMSLFLLRDTSRNTPSRSSEWGSSLPPDCFASRGSISPCEYFLTALFHWEALLAPRPIPKQVDTPRRLSATA